MSVGKLNWRYPISFQGGFRNWNWVASQIEPDGRILMPANLLHPDDGHVADADGYVDVTRFKGLELRMRKRGVLRILHLHEVAWPLFERCHWVPRGVEGGDTWYHFDPGTSFASIYRWWALLLKEPRDQEQFQDCRSFMKLANPPPDMLPPRPVIRGAVRRLGGVPSHFTQLRSYFAIGASQRKAVIAAAREEAATIAAETKTSVDRQEREWSRAIGITEDDLAARVPFLVGLAHSCFDPQNDPEDPIYLPPDATSRSRLARVSHGFMPAAFFTYSKAPSMRQPTVLPRYIRSFDRFMTEALADNPDFDIASTTDVDRAFAHVAFGELLALKIGRPARDRMVQDAASVFKHARRTMLDFDPQGAKGIASSCPAEQSDRRAFLKRVESHYADNRKEYGASRKTYADRVKNAYERTLDAGVFRLAQLKQDGDAMREAIDFLCSPERAHLPYADRYVDGRELSERGQPTGRTQTRRYRIWRIADAWLSLEHDRAWSDEPAPQVWRHEQARAGGAPLRIRGLPPSEAGSKDFRFHGSEFVCEYLETHAEGTTAPAIEPFLITLARHHAFVAGGQLDVMQRREKEDLLHRWKLTYGDRQVHGLLKFEKDRARLARTASRSERRNRRLFVPMEEAEHALRLAGHGVDAVAQTWCRQSEFIQQVDYANFWESDAAPGAFGWWASRKLSRGEALWSVDFIECDEEHYLSSRALVDLQCRRCRFDEVPLCDPPSALAYKLEPAPYVMSLNGRIIPFASLTCYLRVLFANVGDFRFHDLRAAASNRARRAGAPRLALGEGLGQRSDDYIELYSHLTEEQLAEQTDEVRIMKHDRIEKGRAERAGA